MSALRLFRNWGAACVLATLMAACATIGSPVPGATQEQVQTSWGDPSASYALPDGQRLFYRRKPGEMQRLDFDAKGYLVAVEQIFTAQHFRTLTQGRWDAAQVQRTFGPPARRITASDKQEESGIVWIYSWLDFGTWRLARVRMNAASVVQGVEFVEDPLAGNHYR